jgi:hypothetical protein
VEALFFSADLSSSASLSSLDQSGQTSETRSRGCGRLPLEAPVRGRRWSCFKLAYVMAERPKSAAARTACGHKNAIRKARRNYKIRVEPSAWQSRARPSLRAESAGDDSPRLIPW